MEIEYWAHHYDKNPAKDEVEDDDFDQEEILREFARQQQGADDSGDWEEVK